MNIGKRIISAFVEVSDDAQNPPQQTPVTMQVTNVANTQTAGTDKFRNYFDQLFKEANLPGPDYYEFAKMTEAMAAIPDEQSRYIAAFAGLQVQGMDKQKLLETANQYLAVLDKDAENFHQTMAGALEEKVHGKQQELEEKLKRIQQLSQEITDLNNKIAVLQNEIKENELKIQANGSGYQIEMQQLKARIEADIQKIKQHIS